LPSIETGLSEAEIVARLRTMSKRGKLPGFEAGGAGLFAASAQGAYVDRVLVGKVEQGEGFVRLRFRTEMAVWKPLLVGVVLALTVWPGVWLTDSMMVTYWAWYGEQASKMWWLTYAWYVPLTVIPLPWACTKAWAKNTASARASAVELIERMAGALDGRVVS
jgi:hypothetical protein